MKYRIFNYCLLGVMAAVMITAKAYSANKADENTFAVSLIPATLKENAHAVVRLDEYDFTLTSFSSARLKVHRAVTVLSKEGERFALFYIFYDPQKKIKEASCLVYDENGKEIRKIKSRDMEDKSASGSGSLYDDNRIRYYEHQTNQYPYTIEYTYEIEFKGLFYYPGWQPVRGEKLSVEQSSFRVSLPQDMKFRYKTFHLPKKPEQSTNEGISTYRWKIEGFAAIKKEPLSPDLSELTPTLLLAPDDFEYEGYAGNLQSWQNFGQWVNQLNEGRDVLPEKSRQDILALVNGVKDTKEKIRKIYQYMQSHTRYVSIQLGIGGYQPFEASTVVETGYGDCKALTNYTKALLQVAGIPSFYTLVNAGPDADPVYADFPSVQFNHAFLCVPIKEDTVWLECTSQDNPFGYLGYFTSDRNVLLVDENGGKIVRTPAYQAEKNIQHRTAIVKLAESGDGTATVDTQYKGLQYSHVDQVLRYPQAEQEKILSRQIDIPDFVLEAYHFEEDKAAPAISEHLELKLGRYAQVSSKRLFFQPNLMNHTDALGNVNRPRKNEVVLKSSYTDVDTIVYELPENMHPEFLPEDFRINSVFGEYTARMEVEQGKLVYVRKLQVKKGRFPASSYKEVQEFYNQIAKADRVKVVLVKST